ncbi:MAG: hypothetical protein ACT4PW_06005 [Acidimicrobiia bacterium]
MRQPFRTGARAAIVVAAIATSLSFATPAGASTGDWGFSSGNAFPPGSFLDLTPGLICIAGPCEYTPSMSFTAVAQNGAQFFNIGDVVPLVSQPGGATAGTCTVVSATSWVCDFTATGTVPTGTVLFATSAYNLSIPAVTPAVTTVVTYTWNDTVETGNNPANDTFVSTVSNQPAVPILESAGLIGGSVALAGAGLALRSRRRRATDAAPV